MKANFLSSGYWNICYIEVVVVWMFDISHRIQSFLEHISYILFLSLFLSQTETFRLKLKDFEKYLNN